MAGLLNLVPRFLPRYGMVPQWAAAVRPLVLVFTVIAIIITLVFQADVDAQGGAYATGVLVLITSASVAVFLSALRKRQRERDDRLRAWSSLVFAYTTVVNVIERPDGVRIAGLFILGILVVSIVSRVQRSFQLRAISVTLDAAALDFVTGDAEEYGSVRIVANEPDDGSEQEYRQKARRRAARQRHPAARRR